MYVQTGDSVDVMATDAFLPPFDAPAGSSQAAMPTLSDSTSVAVSFDEASGNVSIGGNQYLSGETLILGWKKSNRFLLLISQYVDCLPQVTHCRQLKASWTLRFYTKTLTPSTHTEVCDTFKKCNDAAKSTSQQNTIYTAVGSSAYYRYGYMQNYLSNVSGGDGPCCASS